MLEPPPPNKPDAGLLALLAAPPALPNKAPEDGAVVPLLGTPKAAVAAGFAVPKTLPPDEGAAPLLLPNTPVPVGVAAPEEVLEVEAPPNRPPAGCCATPPLCCPNKEPGLPEGAALLPAAAVPCVPKANLLPLAGVEPKRPPAAGAEEVALFCAALVELGVPKVNDMFAAMGAVRCLELRCCSIAAACQEKNSSLHKATMPGEMKNGRGVGTPMTCRSLMTRWMGSIVGAAK